MTVKSTCDCKEHNSQISVGRKTKEELKIKPKNPHTHKTKPLPTVTAGVTLTIMKEEA